MKLYEYQAKQQLSLFGIPIPLSTPASSPDEVYNVAVDLDSPILIKPQVVGDSQEEAEAILYASNPEDARHKSAALFSTLKKGDRTQIALVETAHRVATSIYVSIAQHHAVNGPVMFAALLDGDVHRESNHLPIGDLASEIVHPFLGLHAFQARNLASAINLPYEYWADFTEITTNLSRCYLAVDALLIEINPLAITSEHRFLALGCQMHIDDYALFRHSELVALTQSEKTVNGLNTRQVYPIYPHGQLGCIANGSGLGMAAMDMVRRYGGDAVQTGCVIDIGGEASESRLQVALQTVHAAPQLRVLLLNIFAVVAPCDQTARILLRLFDNFPQIPTVIRLAGINAEEGIRTFKNANLKHVIAFYTLTQAAVAAVNQAKNGGIWQS